MNAIQNYIALIDKIYQHARYQLSWQDNNTAINLLADIPYELGRKTVQKLKVVLMKNIRSVSQWRKTLQFWLTNAQLPQWKKIQIQRQLKETKQLHSQQWCQVTNNGQVKDISSWLVKNIAYQLLEVLAKA